MYCEYKCKAGKVVFAATQYPNCCGIAVLSNVGFYLKGKSGIAALYKQFHNYVLSNLAPFDLRRKTVLMADKVSKTDRPSMYNFCKAMGWSRRTSSINPKTGNKVVLFVLHRPSANVSRV